VNSTQAREILALYRPGTDDPASEEFAQAMSLVRSDSELKLWFDQHCAAHEAVRARFHSIIVPEGLKEQILSERKVRTTMAFRRTVSLYAGVAALCILVAGVAVYYSQKPSPEAYALFQGRMTGTLLRGTYPEMDLETNDLSQIRKYLAGRQAFGDYVMPDGLSRATSTGCKVLQWHGKNVAMVCFKSGVNPGPGPDLYLFVISRSSVSSPPPSKGIQTGQKSGLAMASWSSGDKTYLLAGQGDAQFLKKYQ
jgi:hypothetical protein